MKAKILLYLFLFALMYVIYQFMSTKKYSEAKEKEIAHLEETIRHLKDEAGEQLKAAQEAKEDRGFNLKSNFKAREYFEDQQIDPDSLYAEIESKIISQNEAYENNPLVPYPGIEGVMRVNRIEVLNNRWILAEYTDGKYWGEAIISYLLDEKNQLQFDTMDGILYQ